MINILIVDDSRFMRTSLNTLLSKYTNFNIVSLERNGVEALKYLDVHHSQVDVIILDFFMPEMNGIELLEQIMKRYPIPTIMITIANEIKHADLYFKSINLGAFDIISKPTGNDSLYVNLIETKLVERINFAVKSEAHLISSSKNIKPDNQIQITNQSSVLDEREKGQINQSNEFFNALTDRILTKEDQLKYLEDFYSQIEKPPQNFLSSFKLLIIGASTGGPPIISEIFSKFKFNPNITILVIQHMPSMFTYHFANRLNKLSPYPITELSNGEVLKAGNGYVAPGGCHLHFRVDNQQIIAETNLDEKVWGIRPAIDYSLLSIAKIFKNNTIAAIFTGMGRDGSFGIQKIKHVGGMTIAQNPDEAVISSMPVEAIQTGCVDQIMSVNDIIQNFNNNTL